MLPKSTVNSNKTWFVLKFVPKRMLSRVTGGLVHLPLPYPVSLLTMTWFARRYQLALDEAERPLKDFRSIGDLFARKLRPGARPIHSSWVHPVDAVITSHGSITSDQLIQAKEKTYSLNRFLDNPEGSTVFHGGSYWTYYLCPTDYHRIHSPFNFFIETATHIPGQLWPVNDMSVDRVDELFSVNERVVVTGQAEVNGKKFQVALVLVGATNVGQMSLEFDKSIVTNRFFPKKVTKTYSPPILLKTGEELGAFHMGSTVIMFVSSKAPAVNIQAGPTKLGQSVI
jgi:phosphatidylserine decarboxylase